MEKRARLPAAAPNEPRDIGSALRGAYELSKKTDKELIIFEEILDRIPQHETYFKLQLIDIFGKYHERKYKKNSQELYEYLVEKFRVYLIGLATAEKNSPSSKYLDYDLEKVIIQFIDDFEQLNPSSDAPDKLRQLYDFARSHSYEEFVQFVARQPPENSQKEARPANDSLPIPVTAPETWKENKQPGETPPTFIKRVYGEWLGKGLTRADIRALDQPLWQSLYNWLRQNEMPADVDLPTLKEHNSRWIERIEQEGATGLSLQGARRLYDAKKRRERE